MASKYAEVVMSAPVVSSCANHDCSARFDRLGKGKLAVFPVHDPKAWGLPPSARQKVVWLCDRCAEHFYVRLHRRTHAVQVVHKHDNHEQEYGSHSQQHLDQSRSA